MKFQKIVHKQISQKNLKMKMLEYHSQSTISIYFLWYSNMYNIYGIVTLASIWHYFRKENVLSAW